MPSHFRDEGWPGRLISALEGTHPETRESAQPGMDIDVVTKKTTRQSEDNDAAELVELNDKGCLVVAVNDMVFV